MSKIEDLIEKLCPDGVKYKEINDIFIIKNGYTPSKNKDEYWKCGDIPWFRMEDIRLHGKILNDSIQHITKEAIKNQLFPKDSFMVATTATIGVHALITTDFLCNQQLTCVTIKEELKNRLNIKFYFYYFDIIDQECIRMANQSGGMPIVSLEKIKKIKVPVPPLEVQNEVVHILNNFTDLSAEISEELKARQKQYEYYRDKLLEIDNAPIKQLKEISNSIFSGKNKERLINGLYPVYGSTGIISSTNNSIYEKEQILIARVGANAGYVHIANGKYDVSDNTLIVDLKENVDLKYVYYQLSSMNLHQFAKGGGQPLITAGQMKEICIPIPEIKKQKEIVEVLEKFYKITNDISEGLPAEIEARQKQYEYYRDKLLDFKELKMEN